MFLAHAHIIPSHMADDTKQTRTHTVHTIRTHVREFHLCCRCTEPTDRTDRRSFGTDHRHCLSHPLESAPAQLFHAFCSPGRSLARGELRFARVQVCVRVSMRMRMLATVDNTHTMNARPIARMRFAAFTSLIGRV